MIRGDGLDDSLQDWAHVGWDEQGHGTRPSLLIGNGFSQNIWPDFKYDSLFDKALQNNLLTSTYREIFNTFGTKNFEVVLNTIATSKAVLKALDQNQNCKLLEHHGNKIRKALMQAVHGVHVLPCGFPEENRMIIAIELKKYMSIYYTNYDLLIYWSMMKYLEHRREHCRNRFFDCFWSSCHSFDIKNTEIYNKEQRSGVYFLHGGLHLYKDDIFGGTFKKNKQWNKYFRFVRE